MKNPYGDVFPGSAGQGGGYILTLAWYEDSTIPIHIFEIFFIPMLRLNSI